MDVKQYSYSDILNPKFRGYRIIDLLNLQSFKGRSFKEEDVSEILNSYRIKTSFGLVSLPAASICNTDDSIIHKFPLKKNSKITEIYQGKFTMLHISVIMNDFVNVKLYTSKFGLDVNKKTLPLDYKNEQNIQLTPLDIALDKYNDFFNGDKKDTYNNTLQIICYLISNGATSSRFTGQEYDYILSTISWNHNKVMITNVLYFFYCFKVHKANINYQDENGNTILHKLFYLIDKSYNYTDDEKIPLDGVLIFTLLCNADASIKNKKGETFTSLFLTRFQKLGKIDKIKTLIIYNKNFHLRFKKLEDTDPNFYYETLGSIYKNIVFNKKTNNIDITKMIKYILK